MEQLYVLQCESGKWYVGKTTDVMRRFEEHKTGKGSAWTRKYKPVSLHECKALESKYHEDNKTEELMEKYGIDHVRGGMYSQLVLPDTVVSVLQSKFRGGTDKCYKCNLAGHFANKCPNEEKTKPKPDDVVDTIFACDYCDRTFTTKFGKGVHEKSCKKDKVEEVDESKKYTCYKCGRSGHKSPDCYARTHVDGYPL
jgi:predicted GIY-YIG superfamily endonuclease